MIRKKEGRFIAVTTKCGNTSSHHGPRFPEFFLGPKHVPGLPLHPDSAPLILCALCLLSPTLSFACLMVHFRFLFSWVSEQM